MGNPLNTLQGKDIVQMEFRAMNCSMVYAAFGSSFNFVSNKYQRSILQLTSSRHQEKERRK